MNPFDRNIHLNRLYQNICWDIIVIGGGATGLGTALDAASRGLKTLLLEQYDFAKGTSSRSTKLVHGGVRYLAQGDIGLVREALKERGLLKINAPHLVKKQAFIIPCYHWFAKLKYLLGLKLYDWLSGKFSFGNSTMLSTFELDTLLPTIRKGHVGGVAYFDGQFDDARLAINLAQTCSEQGGTTINYMQVTGLTKDSHDKINGVTAYDTENKKEYQLKSKIVINATGVFVDEILQMDTPHRKPLVRPSQGVHIVLDRSFLPGDKAIMIPKTSDGRVLFAVPWHEHILVGTTDTPLATHRIEPIALQEEIDFILATTAQYLTRAPSADDIKSVFAGLRPLAAPGKNVGSTKEISRSHKLIVGESQLITITGGKWTTYRKMAEDTVNKALKVGHLPTSPCITPHLRIHGFSNPSEGAFAFYGSDEKQVEQLQASDTRFGETLMPGSPYTVAHVLWAVRHEMAMTVEDVLARRLRVLFLDARSAMAMAQRVAEIMAQELGYDHHWQDIQVQQFDKLAHQYTVNPHEKVHLDN